MMAGERLYYVGAKGVIRNSEGKILLLHIIRQSDHYEYWDLPGGRVKDNEDVSQTLIREVAEETGVKDLIVDQQLMMAITTVRLPLSEGLYAGLIFSVYLCSTGVNKIVPESNMTPRWCSVSEAANLLKINRDYPVELINRISSL